MTAAAPPDTIRVVLIGNPNTGKSTLFTALVGVQQRVGNYPGVTVEKKTGQLRYDGRTFELVDLPGTYSLAPRSPDEMLAVDVLLGRRAGERPPDIVLSIVDASNLERNLFLVSQILSLGLPTVVALNMADLARDRHLEIDIAGLSERLGVPVVRLEAHRRIGVAELKTALVRAAAGAAPVGENPFPDEFQRAARRLGEAINAGRGEPLPAFLVERLLLDGNGYLEHELLNGDSSKALEQLHQARASLTGAGVPLSAVEAIARYDWVARILDGIACRPTEHQPTLSDRIDAVLTHKLSGTLIFVAVMALLFSSIFVFAEPAMGWVDAAVGRLGSAIEASLPDGALRSLLADGVVGGVGAVVIFLPQIIVLFFFIALLEDCGYMVRAAFLMDRMMAGVGLSGKSFIPLLSSFACAVPGIMATRVIEHRRDRLITILIAPLMSCSARLPIYVILIGAFVPDRRYLGGILGLQGLVLLAMYSLGIFVAIGAAWVLKRTLLRGETPPFVLELPSYKMPSAATVLHRMGERGWAFLRRAGTVIFAVTVLIWALAYYPRSEADVTADIARQRTSLEAAVAVAPAGTDVRAAAVDALAEFNNPDNLDHLEDSLHQRYSVLGRAGQLIEPAVRPLGWDWRIGCAVIASLPAREVVMGVLGVIYNLGEDVNVRSETDQNRLREQFRAAKSDDTGEPAYNLPVALSIMVFFALCAQCAATLAVIRRETNSWRWPAFTLAYMTTLAYIGALVTYQVGIRLL